METPAGLGERNVPAVRVRELAALIDALPVPVALVAPGREHRLLHANAAFAGVARGGVSPGTPLREAAGLDVRTAGSPGVPSAGPVVVVSPTHAAGDGQPGPYLATVTPGQAGSEDALHAQLLHDLAAIVGADRPIEQVYMDTLRSAASAAGARRGVLLLNDGTDQFTLAATTEGVRVGTEVPWAVTVDLLGSPVWEAAVGQRRLVWPSADRDYGLGFVGKGAWATAVAVGLPVRGRALALLVLADPESDAFRPVALARLDLAVALLACAVDNARYAHERAHLRRLLGGATATSAVLLEATEPERVSALLLQGLVEQMELDGAALWRPAPDGRQLLLTSSAGLPEEVRRRVSRLPADSLAARLARGAFPPTLVQAAGTAATSSWEGHTVRLIAIPEPASGVLGVYVRGRLPELVDGILATLAHALAAAIHQTTLHRRVRTVVDSLQRELRPREIRPPAGVDVGSFYHSATSGVDVGGDFYDFFPASSGHLGLVCGDVSGKGVEAASLTAMAVYSLRAFALQGTAPQIVLTMLNGTVTEQTADDRFVTLAYARLNPQDWTVDLALAGHPPPVLVSPGRVSVVETAVGVPVGIDPIAAYTQVTVVLNPGQALVLYTDGVTEARHPDPRNVRLLGTRGLLDLLQGLAGLDAQAMADGIWEGVRAWSGGGTTDDCAVMVVRRIP